MFFFVKRLLFLPFRTLSKKTSAFWRKLFKRLVKIAFTCPGKHREDHFLERKCLCKFWTLIETKSTLWKKFSTGSSKLDWTSPEIHSAGTMFQKKFLQSISGFERIICGVLTKLFWQIFYRCIYTSRRTTWGLLICGKKSFFIFFWPCPKQNQPNGIYFFAIVVKTAFNRTIGAFWGEVFLKKYIILINFGQWAEQFRRFGETLSTSSHNCTVRVPWNAFSKVVFLRLWVFNHF